jgi:hypothetical protein
MKLIGFWLLLLLAVLVPATAKVAASMFYPSAVVAMQTQALGHATQATTKHVAAKALTHGRRAQAKTDAKVGSAGDQSVQHCCDANPCSHCMSCGTCASMAVAMTVKLGAPLAATSSLADLGVPRAEFLVSGQERPPRSA